MQIQCCRACLKPPEEVKLSEFSLDSDIMKSYFFISDVAEVELFIDFFFEYIR